MASVVVEFLKSDRSFFIFTRNHPLRKNAIRLTQSRIFKTVALGMVIANCFTLATMDPCLSHYDTSSFIFECPTAECMWLRMVDAVVLVFFTVEMLLKMLALCAFGHRGSYLADSWNRLDGFIVVVGMAEYFFIAEQSSNLTLLRILRVLRPLRAIRRIPNLRLLVTLLFDTLTALSNVAIIFAFVYFVFGITGLQLWSGVLRQRCYLEPGAFNMSEYSSPIHTLSADYFDDDDVNSGDGSGSPAFYEDSAPSDDSGLFSPINISTTFSDLIPAFYLSKSEPNLVCGGYFQCERDIPNFDDEEPLCEAILPGSKSTGVCRKFIAKYTDCRPLASNPNGISFDNIGAAWITIFQAVSLEGWSDIMYMVQDGHSFWVWPYFILLVVFGSFATTNLCFVVIATQIPQTKRKLALAIRNEKLGRAPPAKLFPTRRKIPPRTSFLARNYHKNGPVNLPNTFQLHNPAADIGVYTQVVDFITDLLAYWIRRILTWFGEKTGIHIGTASEESPTLEHRASVGRCNTVTGYSSTERAELIPLSNMSNPTAEEVTRNNNEPSAMITDETSPSANKPNVSMPNLHVSNGENVEASTSSGGKAPPNRLWHQSCLKNAVYSSRVWLHCILDMSVTHWFMALVILANTVCLATEYHNQPESLTQTVEIVSLFVVIVFAVEFVAKIYALGFYAYIRDGFNMVDTIILVVCLIELLQESRSGVSVLRTFRLIRFLKLLRFFPTLQRQLAAMLRTLDNVATFLLLLGLFFLIFSMIGMSLFGCRYHNIESRISCKPSMFTANPAGENDTKTIIEDSQCKRWEAFDTPLSSLLTVLQILTQDDGWSQVMRDAMESLGAWAALYFVTLVIFGSYVLLSMLLAIIEVGLTRNFGHRKNSLYSPAQSSLDLSKSGDSQSVSEAVDAADGQGRSARMELRNWITKQLHRPCFQFFKGERFSKDGDYSLFIFASDNKFRRWLFRVVTSIRFDQMVLLVIFLNCVIVAFERPSIPADSYERWFLDTANHAFNFFFIIEAFLKIIAEGFFYGPQTYLRNGWNIFDFILVVLSVIELVIEINEASFATAAIRALHILRLFHTFRPLRAINRAPGLKMVIKTLATTIKPIGTILLITLCIFFVFGILGVQLYKGCFYRCKIESNKSPQLAAFLKTKRLLWRPPEGSVLLNTSYRVETQQVNESLILLLNQIENREQCLEHEGLEWINAESNFDSLGHALMTLFVLLSFDGWKVIAQNGLSCVAVDRQPIPNYNPWHLVFFMSFLMINGFCLVDMFAGVVVNNYGKVKEALEKETYQKLDAVKDVGGLGQVSVNFVRRRGGLMPDIDEMRLHYWDRYPRWRLLVHKLFMNKFFDMAIELTIVVNVLAMAIEHYKMPEQLKVVISIVNGVVLVAFIFEAFVRFVALGAKRYFRDKWHWLDLAIIILSLIGLTFELVDSRLLPINPSMIRAARVCRVTRIFRLVKMATGIQGLFQTVLQALPQVGNLSLLLVLLFFIYGSLGVELFGKLEPHHKVHGLSRHANFHNIGMSTLALFRIATADRWHELLNDVLLLVSKPYCFSNTATNGTAVEIDLKSSASERTICAVVSLSIQFYFVSFIILVQFVLINIVVTVLMRQLEEADRQEIFERARQKMAKHEESMLAIAGYGHSTSAIHRHMRDSISVEGQDNPTERNVFVDCYESRANHNNGSVQNSPSVQTDEILAFRVRSASNEVQSSSQIPEFKPKSILKKPGSYSRHHSTTESDDLEQKTFKPTLEAQMQWQPRRRSTTLPDKLVAKFKFSRREDGEATLEVNEPMELETMLEDKT